jgi:uncharacterized protein involved in type VI secretion and phage assembly
VSRVLELLQAVARHEQGKRAFCELAQVTGVQAGDAASALTVDLRLVDTDLALAQVPVATGLTGAAALPRVDDVVLVVFPRGDLATPVVLAQLYTADRRPPTFAADEATLSWPGDATDPEAKAVRLSVRAGDEGRVVVIELGGDRDARVEVRDGAVELSAGGASVRIDHSSSSDGKVSLQAGGTRIELAQDGDLKIEAAGKLILKGTQVEIEGDTKVKVAGQVVELN